MSPLRDRLTDRPTVCSVTPLKTIEIVSGADKNNNNNIKNIIIIIKIKK